MGFDLRFQYTIKQEQVNRLLEWVNQFQRKLATRLCRVRVSEQQKDVGPGADFLAEREVNIGAETRSLVCPALTDDPPADSLHGVQPVRPGQNALQKNQRCIQRAGAYLLAAPLSRMLSMKVCSIQNNRY